MRVVVKRWGNSASVRMPAAVMAAARLRLDQPGDVREKQGRIIEPVPGETCDLAALIGRITDENRHEAVETGTPVGREAQ